MNQHLALRTAALGLVVALVACDDTPSNAQPPHHERMPLPVGTVRATAAPSGSSSPTSAPVAIPYPAEKVGKVVNPNGEAAYSGPSGTLRGTVHIAGDAPPDTAFHFPGKCSEAGATYGKLFRVGLDKALADVLVSVTKYTGFVPAREQAAKITIHGCALKKRTMAVTYGQRVEVANLDPVDAYMPYLDGASSKAIMVAVPGGDSVKLYPQQPGHYLLRDELPNPFLTADIFVLAYATHDVTGLDGQYEIKDIPVGKVNVNAYLPALNKTVESVVEIKAGDNTADFTITFDKGKDVPAVAAASASAAASAVPSAKAAAGAAVPKR